MIAGTIFLSISVSPPDTRAKLPRTFNAAKRMAAWAHANAYATVLVHDEELSVVAVKLLR